jgi:hypothetical protein
MVEPREDARTTGPVAAYIVAGVNSSGNRLLASALVRSGCVGEGSTNQPMSIAEIPPPEQSVVIIKHGGLTGWIRRFRELGYQRIVVIIPIREPIANCASIVARGHLSDVEDAYHHRIVAISRNMIEALAQRVDLELITYEGLSEPFLKQWLPRIGLPYVTGHLALPGQHASSEICNQNAKHYS